MSSDLSAVLDLAQSTLSDSSEPRLSPNPSGLPKVELMLHEFLDKDFETQRKDVEQSWLELAYVLPRKAVHFALRATKKEFNALQSLVTAAAIAKDKRFPSEDSALSIKIPARLLGSFQGAIVIRSSPQSALEAPDASSD